MKKEIESLGTYRRQTFTENNKVIKEIISIKFTDGSTQKIIIDNKKHKITDIIELSEEAIEELREILIGDDE